MKNSVTIPKSELRTQLDQAAVIKAEMTALLRELEERATGQTVTKPGSWRHHPADWAERHRVQPPKAT